MFRFLKKFKERVDFKYFEQEALKGDADAQFNLGNIYSSAHGVPLDHDEAQKWWEMAAAQGHLDAQHNLLVLSKMREKLGHVDHVLPTLTNGGLTLETFTTEEIIKDIRMWKEETVQYQNKTQGNVDEE